MCLCDCGRFRVKEQYALTSGANRSCGCEVFNDLTNQTFGRWTARWPAGRTGQGATYWLCSCECGKLGTVKSGKLISGRSKSCGCLMRELASARIKLYIPQLRHGHARKGHITRTHSIWMGMNSRCNNPNREKYKDYGARGIKVCERWHKFENFLADMGEAPRGLSIDRFPDPDGNYEPGNCRWATPKQQAANRSKM